MVYLSALLLLFACKSDPADGPPGDSGSSDTAADTDSGTDTDPVGDGTELVLLGYLGDATADASGWTGTEAMQATASESGAVRCRFEWTTTGTPHPHADRCDGCSFAHEVQLTAGQVVGPSCDWLFEKNGPPPADGGSFPYAYHPDFEGGGPALLYYYVDRWILLTDAVSYDGTTRRLTYAVPVGEDYF